MGSSSARLATADSRDAFLAVKENERRRGPAVAPAPASVNGAVSDIATPACIKQTTPALVKERARVLCCRRARVGRGLRARPRKIGSCLASASAESGSDRSAIAFHATRHSRLRAARSLVRCCNRLAGAVSASRLGVSQCANAALADGIGRVRDALATPEASAECGVATAGACSRVRPWRARPTWPSWSASC
jgi:hypothetical protein